MQQFDYSKSDSIFLARSGSINAATPSPPSRKPTPALHQPLKFTAGSPAVNINTATKAQLIRLPGIGPAYAERIIRYRQEHRGFASAEDLLKVPGIGKKKVEQLRGCVAVK